MDDDERREYWALALASNVAVGAVLARLAAERPDGRAFIEDVWKLSTARLALMDETENALHARTAEMLSDLIDAALDDMPDATALINVVPGTGRQRRRRLRRPRRPSDASG